MLHTARNARQKLTDVSRILETLAYDSNLSKEDEALVRDAESLLDDARMKLFLVDKQD